MSVSLYQSGGSGGSSLATPVSLANGGTHADLSATGGANQVVKQTSLGGNFSVAALLAADIPNLDASKITTGLAAIATSGKWSDLQSATGALTLANAGNATTFNQTSAVTWKWANTTAAISGTAQSSPLLQLDGSSWSGAAAVTDSWTIENVCANSTTVAGTSELKILHSAGTTGSAVVDVASVVFTNGTTGGPFISGGLGFDGTKATAASSPAIMGAAGANLFVLVPSSSTSVNQPCTLRFYTNASTTTASPGWEFQANPNNGGNPGMTIQSQQNVVGASFTVLSCMGTSAVQAGILFGGNGGNGGKNFSATSGTQIGVACGNGGAATVGSLTFNPASGTANFIAVDVNPTINQTGTASGNYTALRVNAVETALLGTSNKLLDLQSGATGGTSRFSVDNSGQTVEATANGATWTHGQSSELLTLSTVGLTTDTTANLLPANSIIEAVVCRVTTTITTTTNWAVGDPTTAARFSAANATLVSGTTSVGITQCDQTGAAGPKQIAAAKVRITCTGANPGAGVIRITVFYRQFVAPTS